MEKQKINLFLDSGAYGAHNRGETLDIQKYIAYIKARKNIDIYANLDVIGDAEASYQNQLIMEKAGLKPIPCFHTQEPYAYLKEYVERYDYIALGGMVGQTIASLFDWLDYCYSEFICDKDTGLPKVKVHGFGITSTGILLRYPWYSVDSSTWMAMGRFGGLLVPKFRNGGWNYREPNWVVNVSTRSPKTKDAGQHISSFRLAEKEIMFRYFEENGMKLGRSRFEIRPLDYELKEDEMWAEKPKEGDETRRVEVVEEHGLSNDWLLRCKLNALYFINLQNNIPEWPWPLKLKKKGFGIELV